MATKITPLYQFTVSMDKQVDQTTERVENADTPQSKTISETIKVTRKINIPVCLKRPSRIEKEEADIERAVWETHFVTKGILPQALLLKTYANYGGILSEEQKKTYQKMQADFILAETKLQRLQVNEPENKEEIEKTATILVDLRQKILDFQQEQAVFFSNTAEAKAREKLVRWLVLHLSYYRPVNADESFGDWTPIFAGRNVEEKLASYDILTEEGDELFTKAGEMLGFVAAVLASAEGSLPKEEVEAFVETLRDGG